MRHHNKNKKFGRVRKQRTALMRSLARSLILHDKIQTTEAKAKDISPIAEKIITRAKIGGVAHRRYLTALIGAEVAKKLVDEVAPRYMERQGGYTRIIKRRPRKSDSAKLAIIELV